MEIADSTVITKLLNGNVSVVATGGNFTVDASSELTKEIDGVKVRSEDGVLHDFKVSTVEKVVRDDGTEVAIANVDTLYSELIEYFFFNLTGGSMPSGSMLAEVVTATLSNGDNNIAHNLGKSVISFSVKNGDNFVATTGSIVDSNNFNINLAGGGDLVDATITLIYIS